MGLSGGNEDGAAGLQAHHQPTLKPQLRGAADQHHPLIPPPAQPFAFGRGVASGGDAFDFHDFILKEFLKSFGRHEASVRREEELV